MYVIYRKTKKYIFFFTNIQHSRADYLISFNEKTQNASINKYIVSIWAKYFRVERIISSELLQVI